MGTLLRFGAWRIMIYSLDHPPAHVHVVGPQGRARIALNCPDGPAIPLDARGIERGTLRRMLDHIDSNLAGLCGAWDATHGQHG
ncbi:MAG TPA: DUF4160 domain-containing protein [Rhodocyclaceae bacterium]|nr:DUF4160 domain-containing protein [Rhodocyclaceae bacterium]